MRHIIGLVAGGTRAHVPFAREFPTNGARNRVCGANRLLTQGTCHAARQNILAESFFTHRASNRTPITNRGPTRRTCPHVILARPVILLPIFLASATLDGMILAEVSAANPAGAGAARAAYLFPALLAGCPARRTTEVQISTESTLIHWFPTSIASGGNQDFLKYIIEEAPFRAAIFRGELAGVMKVGGDINRGSGDYLEIGGYRMHF